MLVRQTVSMVCDEGDVKERGRRLRTLFRIECLLADILSCACSGFHVEGFVESRSSSVARTLRM